MFGFFIFIVTVVIGALGLLWGLRLLGVVQPDQQVPGHGAVPNKELERIQDALAALESRFDALQDQQLFLERLLAGREERGALPPEAGGASKPADSGSKEVDSILFDTGREERP